MEIVFERREEVGEWVRSRVPLVRNIDAFGPFAALGVADGGELVAGVVYHGFRDLPFGNDMQLSVAADNPGWARRGILRALLRYPFWQLGCARVTTLTAASNHRALRFNEGLGFVREGICRRSWDGREDMIVCGLLREDAERWIRE